MTQAVFYVFAVAAVLAASLCILQRNPRRRGALAGGHHVLARGDLRAARRRVHRPRSRCWSTPARSWCCSCSSIMLLNLSHADLRHARPGHAWRPRSCIVGLLAIELAALWRYTPRPARGGARAVARASPIPASRLRGRASWPGRTPRRAGVVGALAAPLFQIYLVPFEITSILLLAAIVGAVVLAKRRI